MLIALIFAGCQKNDDKGKGTLFYGTDQFLTKLTIGDVPIRNGKTFNLPLAHISSIGFEFAQPVTPESLNGTLEFALRIENIDKGTTALLTSGILDDNGNLVWLDSSNRRLEFRFTHPLNTVTIGGESIALGVLGDRFRIHIDYLTGVAADGNAFSLLGEEFYVVWTASSSEPSS
jgi:hypothetical protein